MKIYITGIAGFLGSHLAKRLINLGHEISGNDSMIQGDLDNLPKGINFHKTDCCDFDEMSKNLEEIDIVYHCAATAHEGLSVFSPNFITKNIYQASISVITASIVNKVKRFVFCSSMARYGSQISPFDETMLPKPEDPYGIAKVAVEESLKLLCKTHSMDYNIAVPHNIVGPNQKYDDPFRNVMSIFINRNLQNKPSIIYGDGNQTRCFSYIDDVIFCLEKLALDKNISKEIINIGPDEETITINDLAKLVANETGFNGDPIHVQGRPLEVKEASCSSEKARKLLGYKTKTSLINSIKLTTNYIKNKGTKEFIYNLPVEIKSKITPETWIKETI
jgi:UDP-glucose 4-epimerase